MRAVIFETQNAVFKFNQKEVKEQIFRKKSAYKIDETDKLLSLISADLYKIIKIPEEPVYFDRIALDLIGAGNGSALCKACNKTYLARQLKTITVGCGGSPFDIKREKKGVIKRLFTKRRKPPAMHGGTGYQCPEGHNLLTIITWKTF